jgi:hypothetical protein
MPTRSLISEFISTAVRPAGSAAPHRRHLPRWYEQLEHATRSVLLTSFSPKVVGHTGLTMLIVTLTLCYFKVRKMRGWGNLLLGSPWTWLGQAITSWWTSWTNIALQHGRRNLLQMLGGSVLQNSTCDDTEPTQSLSTAARSTLLPWHNCAVSVQAPLVRPCSHSESCGNLLQRLCHHCSTNNVPLHSAALAQSAGNTGRLKAQHAYIIV